MVKPCPKLRAPCYLEECQNNQGCKLKREEPVSKPRATYCHIQQQTCSKEWCILNKACYSRNSHKIASRHCELYNATCKCKDCIEADKCQVSDQIKAERMKLMAAPTSKQYRVCPCAMPGEANNCMDPDCLKHDKCMDELYGAIAVQPKGGALVAGGLAANEHICPHDKENCQMIVCDGGKSCYAAAQAMKPGSTTSYTGYHSPGTTQYKDCHTGMHSIGFIGKAEIMLGRETAAKGWDVARDGPIGLIIGLLGDPYPQGPVVGLNAEAKAIQGMQDIVYIKPPVPNIWIKWPDYGVVPFERAWWDRLMAVISKVEGAVLIYCFGGHGRTGTAGAIIGCLGGIIPADADCPVKWLRAKYCDKIVESDVQLDYIEKITGRKVTAHASKGGYTYTAPTGGHTTGGTATGTVTAEKKSLKATNHGGFHPGASRIKKNRTPPQRLSIKKWKQWWRNVDKRGEYADIASITRPKDIPNGRTFKIGKRSWEWAADEHVFVEVKKS